MAKALKKRFRVPRKPEPEPKRKVIAKTKRGAHNSHRQRAAHDFIMDVEGRSQIDQYNRADRTWKKIISLEGFHYWAAQDKWVERRAQFWESVEQRVIDEFRDKVVKVRFEELQFLNLSRSYMQEYALPVMDKKGNVQRYPWVDEGGRPHPQANKPIYALPMPSIERFIKAFLDLDARIMDKRGDIRDRLALEGDTRTPIQGLDPVSSKPSLTQEEARSIAKMIMRKRLKEEWGDDVIDALPGDDEECEGKEE